MDNLLQQVLDKLNVGVIVIDSKQNIIIWNCWLERFTRKSREQVVNKKLSDICPRFSEDIYQRIISSAIFRGQGRFCSATLHKVFIEPASGGEAARVLRQNLLVEPISYGEEKLALLQLVDVTSYHNRMLELKTFIKSIEQEYEEVKESDRVNRQLALHDPLTGLPNRLLLMDRLLWSINYAKRNNDIAAVMFIDMDGFKGVNDTFGHEIGDKLLVEIAERLKRNVRTTDTIARLGGDEFIILLTQIKEVKNVELVAKKILDTFDAEFSIGDIKMKISLSAGISIYPHDGEEPEILIRKADFAMYEVKRSGKKGYKL